MAALQQPSALVCSAFMTGTCGLLACAEQQQLTICPSRSSLSLVVNKTSRSAGSPLIVRCIWFCAHHMMSAGSWSAQQGMCSAFLQLAGLCAGVACHCTFWAVGCQAWRLCCCRGRHAGHPWRVGISRPPGEHLCHSNQHRCSQTMDWHGCALLQARACCLQLLSGCPGVAVPGMQSYVTCMLAVSLLKHFHRVPAHRGTPALCRRLSGAISWWCAWQACSLTLLSQILGGKG